MGPVDNRGKKTAGVDGVASLTPQQRLLYARRLRNLDRAADPALGDRTYLSKPDGGQRPLGIPTMLQRAYQALVKLTLEPEWEAAFEANSYGFRPGRSPHDAIEAVFNYIRLKPKYVLKADIEKCFDKIDHQALLDKLKAIQPITKLIRGWLKAGIVDQGQTLFPEMGLAQGGVISPLLMNIALHGLEEDILKTYPKRHHPAVIRFADDVLILHHDLDHLYQIKQQAETWLNQMGLQLNPTKTYLSHTFNEYEGRVGFDFLGFTVRQYPVGTRSAKPERTKVRLVSRP